MSSPVSFPDRRWGSHEGLRRAAGSLASTRFGAWAVRTLTPLDRVVMRKSKGRFTALGPLALPTVLLTSTGRKSGLPRESPLLCVNEGNRLIVVGSNFGQAQHPAWTANLLANPQALVAIGGREIAVVATPVTGAERDALYERFVTMMGNYGAYRERTSREIRMFALTVAEPE